MYDQPPIRPPEQTPEPKSSGATIAGRAALGFLTYLLVGWLSLSLRSSSPALIVLLVIGAIVLAVMGKWRGFALGVFIGVGLTLLLIGICLATFKM